MLAKKDALLEEQAKMVKEAQMKHADDGVSEDMVNKVN